MTRRPTWTATDVDKHAVIVAVRHGTVLVAASDESHRIEPWDGRYADALDVLAELLDWVGIPCPFDPPDS